MGWDRPPRAIEPYIARPEVLDELDAKTWYDFRPYGVNDVVNVWALQRALNRVSGADLAEDGVFGEHTEDRAKRYQRNRGLVADGVVGPTTQRRIIVGWLRQATGLPPGLLDGQVQGESGFLITAVNWSKAGGVDCGATQRRVIEPYNRRALLEAFDVKLQLALSLVDLRSRFGTYLWRDGTQHSRVLNYIPTPEERSWRLAMLFHNYQVGADNYSKLRDHRSSYWTTTQEWVTEAEFEFEDGAPVRTPFDWCQNYALGSPQHRDRGNVCELVEDWTART